MRGKAEEQLATLARVHDLLGRAGLDYWLFGGWAVDFYAGSVTRAHDDVDIAVWLEDLPRLAALLEEEGWRHAPEDDEDGGTGYERDGVRLELTFLVRTPDGAVHTPFAHGRAHWADGTFADDWGELDGVRARLVGLEPLTLGKSFPRDDAEDAAKDRADYEVLARLEPAG